MSSSFVIPLGTSGLSKAQLGLRYYLDGVANPTVAAAATVAEIGSSGDYGVSGLPAVYKGSWSTVTWEYPAGAGGFRVYPHWIQTAAPPNLIIPVRETGLAKADFSLALTKDLAAQSVAALTVSEVGSPGDYRIAGWPTSAGDWVLRWRRAGISFSFGWRVLALGTEGGAFAEYHRALRLMLKQGLQVESPTTLVFWPNRDVPYLPGATKASPKPVQKTETPPWIRMTVVTGDNPRLTSHHREHYGTVLIQIFQPRQKGPDASENLLTALQAIFDRKTTTIATGNTLAITDTRIKEIGPEPEGWFQTNFEAAFSWTQRDAA